MTTSESGLVDATLAGSAELRARADRAPQRHVRDSTRVMRSRLCGSLISGNAGNRRDIFQLDPENFRVILDAVLRQARPPSPLAGRLSVQSLLFALGEGTFMTGSAVFFTQIVGLSAAQVGLGLTCAGIAQFVAALPMGKVVDRFGPKRMWAVSAVFQGSIFALW